MPRIVRAIDPEDVASHRRLFSKVVSVMERQLTSPQQGAIPPASPQERQPRIDAAAFMAFVDDLDRAPSASVMRRLVHLTFAQEAINPFEVPPSSRSAKIPEVPS